jgi:hypothetical protein
MVIPPYAPTLEQASTGVISPIPAASRASLGAGGSAEHTEVSSVATSHLHIPHVLKPGAEGEYIGPPRPLDAVPRKMTTRTPKLYMKHLTKASALRAQETNSFSKTVQQLVFSHSCFAASG